MGDIKWPLFLNGKFPETHFWNLFCCLNEVESSMYSYSVILQYLLYCCSLTVSGYWIWSRLLNFSVGHIFSGRGPLYIEWGTVLRGPFFQCLFQTEWVQTVKTIIQSRFGTHKRGPPFSFKKFPAFLDIFIDSSTIYFITSIAFQYKVSQKTAYQPPVIKNGNDESVSAKAAIANNGDKNGNSIW